jgi:hypothetical protein
LDRTASLAGAVVISWSAPHTTYDVTLLELARAYGMIQLRKDYAVYEVRRPRIYTMEQALLNLDHVVGGIKRVVCVPPA